MARTGRPTDFRPQYGEEILNLMSEGLSLAAAAAALGIHRQRVYEWVERHLDFADIVKLAQAKRQLFLERRLLKAENSPTVVSTIFALKNAAAADWRDKHEHELTGKDGGPIETADVTDDMRAKALAAFIARTRPKGEADEKSVH